MKSAPMKFLCVAFIAGALAAGTDIAAAGIVITEVDPYGSNSKDGYAADWFELTNTSTTAVSISSLTMIDDHADSNAGNATGTDPGAYYAAGASITTANDTKGTPAPLSLAGGLTTLDPGQTAVFLESNSDAAASAALISSFETAWFGSSVPSNLLVGVYDDAGNYGLSQTNDMVNIFQSGSLLASVAFGDDNENANGLMPTFDNTAGLNNAVLSTASVVGVNGAFESASGKEVGSPDVAIAPVPLPDTLGLLFCGMGVLGLMFGRRQPTAA